MRPEANGPILFMFNLRSPYQEALSTLQSLHILPQPPTRQGPPQPVKHNLNPTFKASLRQAITGG